MSIGKDKDPSIRVKMHQTFFFEFLPLFSLYLLSGWVDVTYLTFFAFLKSPSWLVWIFCTLTPLEHKKIEHKKIFCGPNAKSQSVLLLSLPLVTEDPSNLSAGCEISLTLMKIALTSFWRINLDLYIIKIIFLVLCITINLLINN